MRKKRVRLSFLVVRTQKMLMFFLFGVAGMLGFLHLFLMNQVAMRGYVLSREMETRAREVAILEQLETKIAQYERRRYLSDATKSGGMVFRSGRRNFLVVKPKFTAQSRESSDLEL